MPDKLKITFVTSKEANACAEEQFYEMMAKALLSMPEFRKEIGLEVEED